MKSSLSYSLVILLFCGLLSSSAHARPPSYTQETNSDGTVTTTASDNSGSVTDQTREQGQQTKEDLERQGYQVHQRSVRYKLIDPDGVCLGINCPPRPVSPCDTQEVCDAPHRNQCVYVTTCRPIEVFE